MIFCRNGRRWRGPEKNPGDKRREDLAHFFHKVDIINFIKFQTLSLAGSFQPWAVDRFFHFLFSRHFDLRRGALLPLHLVCPLRRPRKRSEGSQDSLCGACHRLPGLQNPELARFQCLQLPVDADFQCLDGAGSLFFYLCLGERHLSDPHKDLSPQIMVAGAAPVSSKRYLFAGIIIAVFLIAVSLYMRPEIFGLPNWKFRSQACLRSWTGSR